jgi:hypothetical protein
MATSLTFTSNSFVYTVSVATASAATASGFQPSSPNTHYDILGGTVSYDRRLYGINCTSTFGTAETVTIWSSNTFSRQLYQVNIPLNSGNTTAAPSVDLFGSSNGAGIFQKQKDANGVPYFNIPAGHSLKASYGTTLTGAAVLNFVSFGETYE